MALAAARARNARANCAGRRAIVVGGTSGIGHGIALRLAKANFGVTLVGRNAQRGQEIVAQMATLGGQNHEFMACDATLISNLRKLAVDVGKKYQAVDVLVETQGIASMEGRHETSEGIDQKLSLHAYGRFALIDAMLPLLRQARSPRVLSVLSAGVHAPYEGYATDPELKANFSLKNAADAAGFYNDLVLDSFARLPENNKVTFVHAAPGFVNTNWGTELPWIMRGLVRVLQPLGTSLEDCGEFMCLPLLSLDDEPRVLGEVALMGAKGEPAAKTKLHEQAREAVWKHTQEVLARIPKASL